MKAARTLLDVAIYQQALLTGIGLLPEAHAAMRAPAAVLQPANQTQEPSEEQRRLALVGSGDDVTKPPRERPMRFVDYDWFRYDLAIYGIHDAIRRQGSSVLAYVFAFRSRHVEYLEGVLGRDWVNSGSPISREARPTGT